jgi:hypothetical protein
MTATVSTSAIASLPVSGRTDLGGNRFIAFFSVLAVVIGV